MSSAITRMIGQAEVNLAAFSRRAAASVADPIKAKSQEVVSGVVDTATAAIKVIIIKLVLGLLAGVMLIVAIVYGLGALYYALLPRLGEVDTRLVIGGIFLAVAAIAGLAMAFWPSGSSEAAKTAEARKKQAELAAHRAAADARDAVQRTSARVHEAADDTKAKVAEATPEPSPLQGDLKRNVETFASILGDAGFRREQAGLKAGIALAGQLKPMQIVSLALIGGYVAGLRWTSTRRR